MNRILVAIILVGLFRLCSPAGAETLFTNPIVVITPGKLDFGEVSVGEAATNTFLLENGGGGVLKGTATVAKPFKILSGDSYALRRTEAQVVTVVYQPRAPGTNRQAVKFTGGAGARAMVMGKCSGKKSR